LLATPIVQDVVMGTGCVVPDESTKKCYSPSNWVSTCNNISQKYCSGASLYDVNDFPKGEDKVMEGYDATHEVPRDCWKKQVCVWDPEHSPPICKADPDGWSPMYQQPKIEGDGDPDCYDWTQEFF
jgi:hypothetical protein